MNKTVAVESIITGMVGDIHTNTVAALSRVAKVVAIRNFFDLEADGPVTDEVVLQMWEGFKLYCMDSSDAELQYMDALYLSKDALKDEVLPRVVYTPFEYDTMVDLYNGVMALHDSVLFTAARAGLLTGEDLQKLQS